MPPKLKQLVDWLDTNGWELIESQQFYLRIKQLGIDPSEIEVRQCTPEEAEKAVANSPDNCSVIRKVRINNRERRIQ